jgi:hypothetical protein
VMYERVERALAARDGLILMRAAAAKAAAG